MDLARPLKLNVECRDSKMVVSCGQGQQDFKWLANVVKARYVALHPQFRLEQFTAINVYTDKTNLYPTEVIINNLRLESGDATREYDNSDVVYVDLLGPKIGCNDPGFQRQKPMWELFAYTPKYHYVEVIFRLSGRQELTEPPQLIGNFGAHTWQVPVEMRRTNAKPKHWEYSASVPAGAEIFFVFLIDGEYVLSEDYECVEDAGAQQLNSLKSGLPYSNYSELRVPKVRAESYFNKKKSGKGFQQNVRRKIVTKGGTFQNVVNLSESQVDMMFATDWRKIQLEDVLTSERDLEKARVKLRLFYDELRITFRYYSRCTQNVAYMNILTFMCFCTKCKIPDKRVLTKSRLTELFHRVNWEYFISDVDQQIVYINDPLNPDNQFTRAEFMEALCRIALIKYDSQPIDYALTSMMDNHIRKHINVPNTKNIRAKLLTEEVLKVFHLYDQRIWTCFHKFAKVEKGSRVLMVKEWNRILTEHGIINSSFSIRNANHCFSLSQQEDSDGDDSDLMEMTFPEFCEALARAADLLFNPHSSVSKPVENVAVDDPVDYDPHHDLPEHLEELFIRLFPEPACHRMKKRGVKFAN